MHTPRVPPRNESRCLRWIAILQLVKGTLMVALALGMLSFLHKDVDEIVGLWMSKAGVNLENRHVLAFLDMLDLVTDKQLFTLSLLGSAFGGVLITQGTGLLLRKQWAKYLTLIATTALVPYETYELLKGFGYGKLAVLLVNLVVVAVMLMLLRKGKAAAEVAPLMGVKCGPKPAFAAESAAL